jgi:DNA-directed RNA polymerase specialized sigma24 family protein
VSATGKRFEWLENQGGSKNCARDRTSPLVEARLARYRSLLRFIAARVLQGGEGIEEAVRNCLLAAACSPPRLENEGALRSWLLRLLMDEALQILYRQKAASEASLGQVLSEVR